jgi:hypothetical protein
MSSTSKVADVAFKLTTFGLFTTTVVSGMWFAATSVNGFMHYGAAASAAKREEETKK